MANMKDVAKAAGVSTATVSHVINNTRHVSDELRQRVYDAMSRLNYRPNTLARGLRKGETKSIGLILPDVANLFFAEIARAVEDIGYANGYSVILCSSDNNLQKQRTYVETLVNKRADGVIFISSSSSDEDVHSLVAADVPTVIVDRDIHSETDDIVLVDNEYGGYLAGQHLVELGHQHIACITGPSQLTPSADRVLGYQRALEEGDISYEPAYVVGGNFQFQSGVDAMLQLLQLEERPSAVFICNDMMAIGAMNAALTQGLRIPEDLAIVGFDDIQLAEATFPPLTTVAQPISQIAEVATVQLLQRINETEELPPQRVILRPELIVRQTTVPKQDVN